MMDGMRPVEWEHLKPIEFHHMRFVAFGPRGELSAWPRSRWRRALYALRGWHFVRDSLFEQPRRFAWWQTPAWTMSVEALSVAEIGDRYGKGLTPP